MLCETGSQRIIYALLFMSFFLCVLVKDQQSINYWMIWSITINLLVFFPKVDMSFDYKTMSIYSFFSIDDYKDKTIDNFGEFFPGWVETAKL